MTLKRHVALVTVSGSNQLYSTNDHLTSLNVVPHCSTIDGVSPLTRSWDELKMGLREEQLHFRRPVALVRTRVALGLDTDAPDMFLLFPV